MTEKSTLRLEVRQTLEALSPEQRMTARTSLTSRLCEDGSLLHQLCEKNATLLGFMPLDDEIDPTQAMQWWLDQGGNLAVPVTDWATRTMQASRIPSMDAPVFETRGHGLREPHENDVIPLTEIAAVLVPGIAFDTEGGRLGRGGGFYDRFLACLPDTCVTIGVCFRQQLRDRIPREPHDRVVATVIACEV
ncbi:MAG: 5-formyltetrahydrofolate cyclo-ligase [Phycisphaerales bacterium]|nr:5-formyltetrahydrofolate cyclo-ligase [Phycisphaerales bacterium]